MHIHPTKGSRIERHLRELVMFSGAILLFSIPLLSYSPTKARSSEDSQPAPSPADTWPPNAQDGGWYMAQPGDENLTVDHIKLPNHFLITFPWNVTAVKWRARDFEFGEGCMIGLMPVRTWKPGEPPVLPPVVVFAPPVASDKGYGQNGNRGNDGAQGERGHDGISFTLDVDRVAPKGSLWILTSGESGGPGGGGSNGGSGGGSRCINGTSPGDDGGRGGDGGNAGSGGRGGDTSAVRIRIADLASRSLVSPVACSTTPPCSYAARDVPWPESAKGNTGAIVIWGAPGCGGNPGPAGLGGTGGDEGMRRNCGFGRRDHVGGAHGNIGKYGSQGPNGSCTILRN